MKVRDLGLVIDADLSMTSHVDNIIRICYSHIRQLRAIRRSLTTESTQALVRAFVHSRLDYCNGALAGLPGYTYKRLQAVLRSAARLCLRLPSFASVSDVMQRDLHWLNFPNRVTYKLCTMAYMCQHEMALVYFRRYWRADNDNHGSSAVAICINSCAVRSKNKNSWILQIGILFCWSKFIEQLAKPVEAAAYFWGFQERPQKLFVWSVNLCFVFDNFTVHASHLFIYNYLWMHLASSV